MNCNSTVKSNYCQNGCLQLNPSKTTLAFSIFTLSNSETDCLTWGFQLNTPHVILRILCLISGLLWPPNRTGWQIKTPNAVLGQPARRVQNSNSCAFQTPVGASHNVHAGYCPNQPELACLEWGPMWAIRPYIPYQGLYHPASTLPRFCQTLGEMWTNSVGPVMIKQPKPFMHNHIQTIIAFKWNLNMLTFSNTFCNTWDYIIDGPICSLLEIWLKNSYPTKKHLQTKETQIYAFTKFWIFSKAIFVNLCWKKCKSYEHQQPCKFHFVRHYKKKKIQCFQEKKNYSSQWKYFLSIYRNTERKEIKILFYIFILIMFQLGKGTIKDIWHPTKVLMLECSFKRLRWLEDDISVWRNCTTSNSNRS